MLNLVAARKGIAIVPERMTTLGGQGITYVPLSDEDAQSICALVLPLQPALLGQAFADILVQGSLA
jgi:DNA-binding transcriptional LysR family regulator